MLISYVCKTRKDETVEALTVKAKQSKILDVLNNLDLSFKSSVYSVYVYNIYIYIYIYILKKLINMMEYTEIHQ